MKKTSILVSFVACLAAIFACTPQETAKNELTVYLSAQESFKDSKATLSVILSDQSSKNVVVNLEAEERASNAIKASALKFDKTVTVDAGTNATVIMVELVNAMRLRRPMSRFEPCLTKRCRRAARVRRGHLLQGTPRRGRKGSSRTRCPRAC